MKRITLVLRLLLVLCALLAVVTPAVAKDAAYQTGFTRWRAVDDGLAGWTKTDTTLNSGVLELGLIEAPNEIDPYPAGGYYGGNFYNGGSYFVGEATSPTVSPTFPFQEAIVSWNADTPDGTWIEIQIRADMGGRWTKWYNLGVWASDASDTSTVQRHSVRLQGDTDGYVAVDTLVLTNKKELASGLQVKLRLFSVDGVATPSVRNVSVAYSTAAPKKATPSAGDSLLWNTLLTVPECSQMVYPDGGNVWCSPTSTSMVLGFWGIDPGDCAPRVQATVSGVYDWIYDGHGNWPFNTAYAASKGLEAYVARFTSLAEAEPWVAAGVPVVMSIAWSKGELTGAPVKSSSGHLVVLVGFDADGNPIVNDPAASADEDVQRIYLRGELESVWLANSGGTVYLIYPVGHTVPSIP